MFTRHHTEETKIKISETLKAKHLRGNSGSFKKGRVPHNKGKKMTAETYEKLKKTMFQTGHKNYNEKPVWSERVTKDGYIELKVSNVPKAPKSISWRPKHLWIYEQYHKVKVDVKKECVVFLDQNKRNFNIENLMLVSRGVHRVMCSRGLYTKDAERTKTNILLTRIKMKQLDRGEDLGLVKKNCGSRYFVKERKN